MSEINILASVEKERKKAIEEGILLRFRVGVLAINLQKGEICDVWAVTPENLAEEPKHCLNIPTNPEGLEKILLPELELMLYGAKIHGVRLIGKSLVFYLTKIF